MNVTELKEKYDLDKLSQEKESLENEINYIHSKKSNKDIKDVSNELAQKTTLYNLINALYKKIDECEDINKILENETDKDMIKMAEADKEDVEKEIENLTKEIKTESYAHILNDPDDNKSVIIEIRAGAGGDEAAIFVKDLFRMYTQYSNKMSWEVDIVSATASDGEGSKEIIAQISGKNVFKQLKYESGVHRVQRIPATESSGRIHTSTASVAVLPEAKNIDITISPEDLKIDVMRASGAGGQHVNKTDSAVRITHIPTNIVVNCQETKYQQQNKDKAMNILKSRIYALEKEKAHQERDSLRLSQIGSAMRAEKIRTYNYPQNRITDHRIKKSWHKLEEVLNGELEDITKDTNEAMINMHIEEQEKNGQ